MEAVANVDREIEKVLSKFGALNQHAQSTLQSMIDTLVELHQEINKLSASDDAGLPATMLDILNYNMRKVKEVIMQIGIEHRDLHGTVSKVGKAIDRNFTAEYEGVVNDELLDDPTKMNALNHAIVEHFLRHGRLDIAETLIKESGLDVPQQMKQPFIEMNQILDALKKKDLQPALDWAQRHRDTLREQNSTLEFKLHRLQFIEVLAQGPEKQLELIKYAREHLQPLAERHEADFETLMGSLLYLKTGLQESPYHYLLDSSNWDEICDIFTRDACALLGLSVDSELRPMLR